MQARANKMLQIVCVDLNELRGTLAFVYLSSMFITLTKKGYHTVHIFYFLPGWSILYQLTYDNFTKRYQFETDFKNCVKITFYLIC